MTQKEVDAIVLEIFNICREKGMDFQCVTNEVQGEMISVLRISDWERPELKRTFSRECFISVGKPLFGYDDFYDTLTIENMLEEVKYHKYQI